MRERLKISRPFFFFDAWTLYLQTHGQMASLARKMLGMRICLDTRKVSLTLRPFPPTEKETPKATLAYFPYEN